MKKELLFTEKHPKLSLTRDVLVAIAEIAEELANIGPTVAEYERRGLTDDENLMCDIAALMFESPVGASIAADIIRENKSYSDKKSLDDE